MANILWIDDNAGKGTARRFGFDSLVFFIEKNGHKIEIASSNEQIEDILTNITNFNLLILDIIMDPLSSTKNDYQYQYGGIDVLGRLSQLGINIPIIILSVMPSIMIKEETKRRGLDIFKIGVKKILRKGEITPSELAELVERIFADENGFRYSGDENGTEMD